jgi:hypothetical protein
MEAGTMKLLLAAALISLALSAAARAEVADNARYDCANTKVIVSGFHSLGDGLGPRPMPVFSLRLTANEGGHELSFSWPSTSFDVDTRTLVAKMDSGRQFEASMSPDFKTASVVHRAPTGEVEGSETCPLNGAW